MPRRLVLTVVVLALPGLITAWAARAWLDPSAAGAGIRWGLLADAAAAVAASVSCALAATRAGNLRARVAWRCQSAACALWTLAPAAWASTGRDTGPPIGEAGHDAGLPLAGAGWAAGPPIAEAGRLCFLVLVGIGFWLTSRGPDRRSRIRLGIDGAIGASAVLIIAWPPLFAGVWAAAPPASARVVAALAYPLGALVVLIAYALLSVTEFRAGRRLMPTLFNAGLICVGAADVRYAQLSLLAGRPVEAVDSGGWLAGFALIGCAALSYGGTTRRRSVPSTARWITYFPYVMIIPGAAMIVAQAVLRLPIGRPQVAAGCVIVLSILLRQLLLLAENRTLVERLAASERELRHQALHDPLTGLGNRTLLGDRLRAALAEDPAGFRPFALLLCDLDDFKSVNDTLGHPVGDELLVQVAARLRAAVRPTDTVVRLGGDEFAVIIQGDGAAATPMARRVWETFQEPFVVQGHRLPVRASVGLAQVTDDAASTSPSELLKAADIAMYEAKRRGKNDLVLYPQRSWSLSGEFAA